MIRVPKVTKADTVFPTLRALGDAVPPLSAIPIEFRDDGPNRWCQLFTAVFYFGSQIKHERLALIPRHGVNAEDAWGALVVLARCFDIKHEHKEAAWAYLASQWFLDARWERKDTDKVFAFEDPELERDWLARNP